MNPIIVAKYHDYLLHKVTSLACQIRLDNVVMSSEKMLCKWTKFKKLEGNNASYTIIKITAPGIDDWTQSIQY